MSDNIKLVIEIDKRMYEKIMHGYVPLGLSKDLMNGTPLSEGEYIKKEDIIDKIEILDRCYGSDFYWETRKIIDKLPTYSFPDLSEVLDRIKAEIEEKPTDYCGGYIGLDKKEVLQIIDNIGKAESEGTE